MRRGRIVEPTAVEPYRAPERRTFRPSHADAVDSADGVDAEARVRDEAFRAGVERGRADATREMGEACTVRLQQLAESIVELGAARERIEARVRDRLLELGLVLASRIVRARIDDGDPVARRIFEELIESIDQETGCRVRVHPADHAVVAEACRKLGREGEIDLIEDGEVTRGGVVIETSLEEIDGRVETALRAVEQAVSAEG